MQIWHSTLTPLELQYKKGFMGKVSSKVKKRNRSLTVYDHSVFAIKTKFNFYCCSLNTIITASWEFSILAYYVAVAISYKECSAFMLTLFWLTDFFFQATITLTRHEDMFG